MIFLPIAGAVLDAADENYLRRKRGEFATSMERMSARMEDVNSARGGVDKTLQYQGRAERLTERPSPIMRRNASSQ